jgi:hypothetical protein
MPKPTLKIAQTSFRCLWPTCSQRAQDAIGHFMSRDRYILGQRLRVSRMNEIWCQFSAVVALRPQYWAEQKFGSIFTTEFLKAEKKSDQKGQFKGYFDLDLLVQRKLTMQSWFLFEKHNSSVLFFGNRDHGRC